MQAFQLNNRVGIGLRNPHLDALLTHQPSLGFVEIHSENWLSQTGPIAQKLTDIQKNYPISLHGVGLSLGSATGLDKQHLDNIAQLVDRVNPLFVSEHLSWGAYDGWHSNDLLPLPYHPQSIDVLVKHIDQVQQRLGRQILVENISSYAQFDVSVMPEWEFVNHIIEKANCGLLLDINNIYVNAINHGFDAQHYLNNIAWSKVAEVHLAGYEQRDCLLIDTHSRPVQPPVWELFTQALLHLPSSSHVLVEWDSDLPPFEVLLQEAEKVSFLLGESLC